MLSYSIISIGYAFNVYQHIFTTEKWLENPTTRVNIVEDMLKENELEGKTKSEIYSLLGKEYTNDKLYFDYPKITERWFYELGKKWGFTSGNENGRDQYLIISFQDNKVIGYTIWVD